MAIEGYSQILGLSGINRPANRLRAVMEYLDTDRLAAGAPDRLQEPRVVDGEQVALCSTRLKATPRRDAACWNLGQVMIGLVVGEPHDGPHRASPLFSPEDLGRALDLGLELARFAILDIGRLDPILVLFHLESSDRDPGDAGRDNSVTLGRLQQDNEPSAMLLLIGSDAMKNGAGLETARVLRWQGKDLVDPQHVEPITILTRTILDANDSCLRHVAQRGPPEALLLALRVAGSLDEGVPGLVRYPVETLARFEWKQLAFHTVSIRLRSGESGPGSPAQPSGSA